MNGGVEGYDVDRELNIILEVIYKVRRSLDLFYSKELTVGTAFLNLATLSNVKKLLSSRTKAGFPSSKERTA